MVLNKAKESEEQSSGKDSIKSKKFETLMLQVWELMPNFCRSNSANLSQSFSSLLPYIEKMINENIMGLRTLALRTFSELISHCKNTSVVTEEIKKTRQGFKRICFDYINGFCQIYVNEKSYNDLNIQDRS